MSLFDLVIEIAKLLSTFSTDYTISFSSGESSSSSSIIYIPAPKLMGDCRPGHCSNGSLEFGLGDPSLFVDQVQPCLLNEVTHNQFIGDMTLDPEIYCDPRTFREVPAYTCCSPTPTSTTFPSLYFFPVGSRAFYTKPIKLEWFNQRDRFKLPPKNDIIFLIQGWAERPIKYGSLWISSSLQAWTQIRKRPVVLIDYYPGTFQLFQYAANARTVGQAIGYALLNWGITGRAILVGNSEGAHVIAEAGKYTKKHGQLIKECVGVDPAGPGFDGGSDQIRLTREDCQVVQILHSSAEATPTNLGVLAMKFGTFYHSGHCDFWINCGQTQGLDAKNPTIGAMMSDVPASRIYDSFSYVTNHYRSHVIYAASVAKQCNYIGIECVDCAKLRTYEGCHINLNGSTMNLPPYNGCKPGDRKDFYVQALGNNYPYCSLSP